MSKFTYLTILHITNNPVMTLTRLKVKLCSKTITLHSTVLNTHYLKLSVGPSTLNCTHALQSVSLCRTWLQKFHTSGTDVSLRIVTFAFLALCANILTYLLTNHYNNNLQWSTTIIKYHPKSFLYFLHNDSATTRRIYKNKNRILCA